MNLRQFGIILWIVILLMGLSALVGQTSSVPTPKDVLGIEVGSRPLRHAEVLHYFRTLAEASPSVKFFETGTTYEGRQLFVVAIATPERLQQLDDIRQRLEKLWDPRKLSSRAEYTAILENTPAIAWMMYGIHGDELSSTDAAVRLADFLARGEDPVARKILEELVVFIDPMENPDGRERYLAQIQQWTGKVLSGDMDSMPHRGMWTRGRGNHYLFDLNRDWFALVHPETRARVKAILHWHPQLVVDAHEMGAYSSYFFPPPRNPIHPYVHPIIRKWWQRLAKDQARAFDERGWSYQTEELFDEWYPGYGSSWPYFSGAVAILYEQARTDGSFVQRPDGTILTFREAVDHHFTSSVANLHTAANHRKELLADFHRVRQAALKATYAGKDRVFLLPPGNHPERVQHLVNILREQKVEVERAVQSFHVKNLRDYWGRQWSRKEMPAGTYIIRLQQPQGILAQALLQFDVPFPVDFLKEEREAILREGGTRIYDINAWSLPLLFGVEAYVATTVPRIRTENVSAVAEDDISPVEMGSYGYVLDARSDAAMRALALMLEKEFVARATTKAFEMNGKTFPAGGVVFRRSENPDSLDPVVEKIARQTGAQFYPAFSSHTPVGPDLGGEQFKLLAKPRVALLTGPGVTLTAFGSLWYLLDQELQIPHALLNHIRLPDADLRKYNVLILPPANGSHKTYFRMLDTEQRKRLKAWVEQGGTLIAIGNAAAFLADTAVGISKVELRRQALKKLNIYQQVWQQEQQLWDFQIDSLRFWKEPLQAETPPKIKPPSKAELKVLEQLDARWRKFRPRGTFLRVNLDPQHWLSFGVGDRIPVLFRNGYAYLAMDPVQTVGRFGDAGSLRISGLLWPEARSRWAGTAYLTRESLGKGQVILFADEPFFRAYLRGAGRLLINAIVLGPGMGAESPGIYR
ncbi:MAG: hypothetical protein GXO78_12775 [Calditrichaeota bacterium]|nr:hypothetical protein [Calditrichota bacterium]